MKGAFLPNAEHEEGRCLLLYYYNYVRGEKLMKPYSQNPDDLRQKLLDDVYAGAFAGTPAMLLEEDEIQKADDEELEEIARRHGIKETQTYGKERNI